LARPEIILLQLELAGLRARVLFGHVEEAGVGTRHELDLNHVGLGHSCDPRKDAENADSPPPGQAPGAEPGNAAGVKQGQGLRPWTPPRGVAPWIPTKGGALGTLFLGVGHGRGDWAG